MNPLQRRQLARFARRRPLAIGAAMVLIGTLLGVTALGQPWRSDQKTEQKGSNPFGPTPHYPDVTDLASDAVDLSNGKTFPSLTYGIHTFFWWNQTYRQLGLDHVNIMQFSHIRQSFAWMDIEPERRDLPPDHPDRYIWYRADAMMADIEAKGVRVVARIDHPPPWAVRSRIAYAESAFDEKRFGEFCGALAAHFRGRIDAYQVWNEPNLTREWAGYPPSPAGYVRLLAACAEAIRRADPAAIIISAGLSPTGTRDLTAMPDEEFLWKLYAAGGGEYFDVLGVHAPGWKFEPERDPASVVQDGYLSWQTFRHVEKIRAIMAANGDADSQIAITEMGWTIDPRPAEVSIYSWFAVTPEQQADYLVRAYRYAADHWRPWVGLIVTIYYPNPDWTMDDEEYWWAIGTVAPLPYGMDGRPAWPALVQMRKISTNPAYAHPARGADLNPIE